MKPRRARWPAAPPTTRPSARWPCARTCTRPCTRRRTTKRSPASWPRCTATPARSISPSAPPGVLSTAASLHELEPSSALRDAVDEVAARFWAQMAALGPVRAAAPAPVPRRHRWPPSASPTAGPACCTPRCAGARRAAAKARRGSRRASPSSSSTRCLAGVAWRCRWRWRAQARPGVARLVRRLGRARVARRRGGGAVRRRVARARRAPRLVGVGGSGQRRRPVLRARRAVVRAPRRAPRRLRRGLAHACHQSRRARLRGGAGLRAAAGSLYRGELGVAVLAAEIARPEVASMPFFEAER